MPTIHHVAPRLTHKYVGTYKHLDEYGSTVRVKVFPGKKLHPVQAELMRLKRIGTRLRGDAKWDVNIDVSEGPTWINWVEAPKGIDDAAFKSAMYGEFDQHGCGHSYDCCGCASYSIALKKIRGRRWIMTTTVSYNF